LEQKLPDKETAMQKIVTFLWFDGQAEQAMKHYTSIFRNSRVVTVTRNSESGPGPKGSVLTAVFELEGQQFIALNGGPQFKFNEAISLVVNCETQAEIDDLWEKLSAGGERGRCGWLKDKFGLSWQIVPAAIEDMLADKDPAKSSRVLNAVMQMDKLDIRRLKQAYEGR
jgi:predicted 3-demethylubiquinone-9 3-methyltransferase (glyoxalase superfamily)